MLERELERARKPPTLMEGRYVISGILGKGGNAGVYQAWDTKLKCWRAIKVLSHEFIRDDQIRARFAQEAATMARLDHRNLVQVYDISDDPFTPHIVMELCSGGSIIQWMKVHGAVPPRLALQVIESTALAVGVAHEDNITHRDIKPQNILIDHKGIIKLTDFGIARDEDNSLTMAGATMGTYAFMAPEQRHDSTQVDWRADIYSLGATLFTLVKVKTTTELFVAERGDELLADLPDPIVDIILGCCAYKPKDRYQSIAECVAAIVAAREKLPPDPKHPPLSALAEPLPPGPPTEVKDYDKLGDLLKSLALNDDSPTFVDRSRPASEFENTTLAGASRPDSKVLPYYMSMPERPREPTDPTARPSYLDEDPEDVEPQRRVHRTIGSDGTVEVTPVPPPGAGTPAPVSAGERDSEGTIPEEVVEIVEVEPGVMDDPRIMLGIAASLALVLVAFFGLVWSGSVNLAAAQKQSLEAEKALIEAIEGSAPVIQQIGASGGDASSLQETYFKVKDAQPGQRAALALSYADDLKNESEGRKLSGVAVGLVEQVDLDAQKYRKARDNWRETSGSLTGNIAITVGLGTAPP
ncbi:MAG: serine/threonine-protein kinase [Myxococcota bacterium]